MTQKLFKVRIDDHPLTDFYALESVSQRMLTSAPQNIFPPRPQRPASQNSELMLGVFDFAEIPFGGTGARCILIPYASIHGVSEWF